MNKKALGLIETYGYIGAIEAADSCLKAADVEIIGLEFIRGGLVTIKIKGNVSAVEASIDVGKAAANKVGKVISVDVIARPAMGLEKIFEEDIYQTAFNKDNGTDKLEDTDNDILGEFKKEKNENLSKANYNVEKRKIDSYELIIDTSEKLIKYKDKLVKMDDKEGLASFKVVELRKIARKIQRISMERSQIKMAKKIELIDAITNCFSEGGETEDD